MSLNGDEGLPADEQPLLPTIQNPSPGEKAPAPKHRTVGDEFVDAATRVDGFFFGQAEGDDADEADDPKAALAASALVIKFLVRRIIKTIRRLGRPKRKTVIAVLIGLFVFVLFCVWSIGLAAYLFNFKEFWTSPTWITSEIEGNARDKYGNPTRDGLG
ncbi:hypothetical protein Q8F55_005974 [Vanrija albida]|uniref:Uncharacterized protein n=1 Tax=Vanrija albida TaxID=181172 RepID=A0ABR3Q3D0_9TREE